MVDKATKSLPTNQHRPLTFVAMAMLLSMLAQTGAAFAEDQRFYVGIAVPVEQLNVSFDKTVDNTAGNTLVPEPRKGMVFQDGDSANTSAYGIGLLAGYRASLAESNFYLAARSILHCTAAKWRANLQGLGSPRGATNSGKAGPITGLSPKTEATASRSSWAAALARCKTSTRSQASAALRPSLRLATTAAWMPVRVHRLRTRPTLFPEQTAAIWICRGGRLASV